MVDTNTKRMAAVGAGLLAAGAAGVAGYYFFAGKDSKKNRRIVTDWASDFKDEIVRRARRIGNLDRDAILGIIDNVAYAYETARNLDRKDIEQAALELREHWQELVKEAHGRADSRTEAKIIKRSRSKSRRRS